MIQTELKINNFSFYQGIRVFILKYVSLTQYNYIEIHMY